MTGALHVFDEAIAVTPLPDATFTARTHPAYNNMVGPFGGVIAGSVINALQQHPDALGAPLAFTVNYVAPVAAGEWLLRPQIVRTNRTNQHWLFTVEQGGGIVSSGSAVFGVRRDTWGDTEATPPAAGEPADHEPVWFPEVIAWDKNYEKRFVTGRWDAQSDDSTSTLWVRDNPPRPLDFPALASIADVFYPRVFLRRGGYVPAGTISLTTYFHATEAELAAQGDDYVLATAHSARFVGGHFDQHGQIFGRAGALLATTAQIVYFKDAASAR
ncbi:thioesterase family protein [Tsukamurella soli]|uniref:Thioesterase family protein n=1 Tax=Tsukamurella soli TaxID=644556 RepID=A0ABP8JU94_9ACTN